MKQRCRVTRFLFCFRGSGQMGFHFAREQLVEVNDARAAGLSLHRGDTETPTNIQCLYQSVLLNLLSSFREKHMSME